MNDIAQRQNTERSVAILKARKLISSRAKTVQGILITVTLLLSLAAVLGNLFPPAKPYLALAGLVISVLDTALIDRWLKDQIKLGARLAEMFDCEVLQLEWNSFLVGKNIHAEVIGLHASKKMAPQDETKLRDWYSTGVASLPLHLARLVCQRENLVWDQSQRAQYRSILLGACLFVGVGALVAGCLSEAKFADVVLAIVPVSPFVLWAMRENNRHRDTTVLTERLEAQATVFLQQKLTDESPNELTLKSRELQDAIYNHRASGPLVFDWLYYRLRRSLEKQMSYSAADWVRRLGGQAPDTAPAVPGSKPPPSPSTGSLAP